MSQEVKEKDYQNDWAFNEDFTKHIHISEAKRGLNDYFCLGCKKEMQAVKGNIKAHYFRHHAKNVDNNKIECVVASKNYRELIAKDILHRLKQLKLPTIYKLPPIGVNGLPNVLKDSETLTADSVKSELSFYEDEDCQIKYGKNPNIDNRYLLIRPDITFFNSKQEPILLVEFVVDHRIDNEKRNKLKRLGINTVQIIIPKKPEAEIEKALKSKSKIKWVYNEIEANTKYIFVPETSNNGIWSIDDEQRRIFEEDYKCRANQIKYLIRTVKRALESQSYKRAEQHFDQEISRVESATKTERQGLEDMEARIDSEVRDELAGRFQAIEFEEEKFIHEEEKFRKELDEFKQKSASLEGRYKSRKEEYRIRRKAYEHYRSKLLIDFRSEDEIREEFSREQSQIRKRRKVIARKATDASEEISRLPKQFSDTTEQEQQDFDKSKRGIEQGLRELRKKIEDFETFSRDEEREFEDRFRNKLYRKLQENPSSFPEAIRTISKEQRLADDYFNACSEEQLYKSAREFFNKGTWKTR